MPDSHRAAFMMLLAVCTSVVLPGLALAGPGEAVLEYPARMLDAYDADGSCWRGMDADGIWQDPGSQPGAPVVPQVWLVGPPPSERSAVTIPEDHWVDLAFSGRIVDGTGTDILLLESGTMGEQALVFLTDGADQEYVVALAKAQWTNRQDISRIEIDLSNNPAPFVARGVRVVGIDFGGGSPGFDLASIQGRVSRECGPKARYPNPPGGTIGVEPDALLSWVPPCAGGEQRIYGSAVESKVRSASTDALLAVLPSDANSFQPHLELAKTYYWRVDAAMPTDANLLDPGDVWSFTIADHVAIDDFETYPNSEFLQDTWKCSGWSEVYLGASDPQTCDLSMDFDYYCDAISWPYVFRQFDLTQDWTQADAKVLQILLRGNPPEPAKGEMYIGLTDGAHGQIVSYAGPGGLGLDKDLYAWPIPLEDFNNVDLAHVRGVGIGIRPTSAQADQSFEGVIRIADISLHPALCLQDRRPTADLNGDCAVDYRDVERLAADWLRARVRSYAVMEPNDPVLWYTFDGHANDSAGTAHGQVQGRATYGPGVYGQAIHLAYQGDAVTIPDAASVFAGITEAITIAFWQYGDDSSHLNDTICCSNYEYGKSNPAISIHLGCWQNPGQYRWDCGSPWSIDNRLAGRHRSKKEWTGRWNHWVFTKQLSVHSSQWKSQKGGLGTPHMSQAAPVGSYEKEVSVPGSTDLHSRIPGRDSTIQSVPNPLFCDVDMTGQMAIYLNGELYDSRTGTDSPITDITSFEIGSGWYGRYDGLIDDFRIYDYALSPAEAAWVATNSTGTIEDPASSPADLDASDRVDFHDFTILATQWLEDTTWPTKGSHKEASWGHFE